MTDTEVVHHPLDGLKFGGIRLGFFDGDSSRFLAITRRIFRVNQCSSKIGTVSNPLIETAESSRILGISCFFFLLFFLLLFLCFIHLFYTDRWSAILNCQVPIEANRWFHSLIKNDSIQVFAIPLFAFVWAVNSVETTPFCPRWRHSWRQSCQFVWCLSVCFNAGSYDTAINSMSFHLLRLFRKYWKSYNWLPTW